MKNLKIALLLIIAIVITSAFNLFQDKNSQNKLESESTKEEYAIIEYIEMDMHSKIYIYYADSMVSETKNFEMHSEKKGGRNLRAAVATMNKLSKNGYKLINTIPLQNMYENSGHDGIIFIMKK